MAQYQIDGITVSKEVYDLINGLKTELEETKTSLAQRLTSTRKAKSPEQEALDVITESLKTGKGTQNLARRALHSVRDMALSADPDKRAAWDALVKLVATHQQPLLEEEVDIA
jgi:hypothetical protein